MLTTIGNGRQTRRTVKPITYMLAAFSPEGHVYCETYKSFSLGRTIFGATVAFAEFAPGQATQRVRNETDLAIGTGQN
jgi:hypothetical protein